MFGFFKKIGMEQTLSRVLDTMQRGEFKTAIEKLKPVLQELDSLTADHKVTALWLNAQCYGEIGQEDKAQQCYERAAETAQNKSIPLRLQLQIEDGLLFNALNLAQKKCSRGVLKRDDVVFLADLVERTCTRFPGMCSNSNGQKLVATIILILDSFYVASTGAASAVTEKPGSIIDALETSEKMFLLCTKFALSTGLPQLLERQWDASTKATQSQMAILKPLMEADLLSAEELSRVNDLFERVNKMKEDSSISQ